MHLLEVMIKRGFKTIAWDVEQFNIPADEPHNPADRFPVLVSVTIDGIKQTGTTREQALRKHGFTEDELQAVV